MSSTNPNTQLPDMIAQERADGPQDDDSPTTRVRRRVLSGEPFTMKQMVAEVPKASEALTSMALRNLRALGFVFETERFVSGTNAAGNDIWVKRYVCTNPDRSVEAMRRAAAKDRAEHQAKNTPDVTTDVALVEAKPTKPPRPEPQRLPIDDPDEELVPLPAVDQVLTVYLAMRERDGTTRIGLRNGQQSWLLTVDAHAVEVER